MKTIWNYVVPVDGNDEIILCHDNVLPVVEIAWTEGTNHAVRFWVEHGDEDETHNWAYQVFGTGHPIPDEYEYVGTAPRTAGCLVWHLYRRRA